jgi:predicted short-subunit dehydrogenase-like oxidoreductase (DUF2520 family)
MVNSLGAGHPVKSYAELDASRLILICAPPKAVGPIVAGLHSALQCSGKTILLCEGAGSSLQLHELQSKGASVGSIDVIPGFDGRRFVAEGDRPALREAKRLVSQLGGRIEEVNSAKLDVYAAGLSFGAGLFTPLMEASLMCLQEAGMPKASAMKVVGALFQRSLRAYLYAGKRSWSGPLADGDRAAVHKQIDALAATHPELAAHYREAAALALKLLGPRNISTDPS